jgi:hypothetical protein
MGTGMIDRVDWLVLMYQLPTQPSRLRATVWRRLKSLGALYLHNSVAALPASYAAERALRTLHREIREMGGTASLMRSNFLCGNATTKRAFNTARDGEYQEIIDSAGDLRNLIAEKQGAAAATYADLETCEERLGKLQKSFDGCTARDVLHAGLRQSAESELERCAKDLQQYASRVFSEESE